MDEMDLTVAESKVTYEEIKQYVLDKYEGISKPRKRTLMRIFLSMEYQPLLKNMEKKFLK